MKLLKDLLNLYVDLMEPYLLRTYFNDPIVVTLASIFLAGIASFTVLALIEDYFKDKVKFEFTLFNFLMLTSLLLLLLALVLLSLYYFFDFSILTTDWSTPKGRGILNFLRKSINDL